MVRRPKKNKTQSPVADMWQDAAEVPRAGLPDADALDRRFRRYRTLARFTFIGFPVMFLIAIFAAINTFILVDDEPPPSAADEADARPQVMAAVTQWLNDEPSPLPGATLVSWDGYVELENLDGPARNPEDEVVRQSHDLTVMSATGTLMDVQVLANIDHLGLVSVSAEPSMSPTLVGAATSDTSWPGLASASLSDDARQAVGSWARAYTSADPVELRQSVGDGDIEHTYVPLSGVEEVEAEVLSTASLDEHGRDRQGYAVARVNLQIIWEGREEPNGPGSSYDVLIEAADSGAPRVVAWGGPGTGPWLEPYGNAITGLERTPDDTPVEDEEEG